MRLSCRGLTLVSLNDVPPFDEAPETAATFEDNALAKARDGFAATGLPTVADDSGLTVAALNGMPGVLSARWSGAHGDDAGNTALLLAQMRDVPDERRSAGFRLSLCVGVRLARSGRPWRMARCDRLRTARRQGLRLRPGVHPERRQSLGGAADVGGKRRGIASRSGAGPTAAGAARAGSLSLLAHKLNCTLTFRVWKCSTMTPTSGMVPASSTPTVFPIGQRTLTARFKSRQYIGEVDPAVHDADPGWGIGHFDDVVDHQLVAQRDQPNTRRPRHHSGKQATGSGCSGRVRSCSCPVLVVLVFIVRLGKFSQVRVVLA